MDGFLSKHAARLLGLAFALIALASLLTFHPQDPTFTNLRYPKDGIVNWGGYPGALLGGSVVEAFGWAALLLPLLIANLLAFLRNRPPWHRYALHGLSLMLAVATAIGMASGELTLGLRSAGLLGWSAGRWLLDTMGVWPGATALTFAGLYSLAQVAYAPQLRRVFGDLRTLSRFGVKQLWSRALERWRALRPQTGWAWHELALLPLHGLLFSAGWLWERGLSRPLIRPAQQALGGWRERRHSIARVKSTNAAPTLRPTSVQQAAPHFRQQPDVPDAFASWMENAPTDLSPLARPVAPSERPITAAPAPRVIPDLPPLQPLPTEAPEAARGPDRVARWEEYLRRYKENLDLDWDERSWKRKRLEELAQDGDEGLGARPPPGSK